METHVNYECWRQALLSLEPFGGFGGFDRAERFIELMLESSRVRLSEALHGAQATPRLVPIRTPHCDFDLSPL
jgi:hypothetical protein